MIKFIKYSFFALLTAAGLGLGFTSFQAVQKGVSQTENPQIIAPPTQTVTQNGILVLFKNSKIQALDSIFLRVSGTYGTTVLKPEIEDATPVIKIPAVITKHAGVVGWQLLSGVEPLQKGEFTLKPDSARLGELENYLGPRSIAANPRDYTMLVSLPTDYLDNMLPDSTLLTMNHQFKNEIVRTPKQLKDGFAWTRIPAPLRSGRLTTGSVLGTSASRELVADVYPDTAVNFDLEIDQTHNYADGNAIISFKTSQIKDVHGNVMPDGTLVYFYMSDTQNKHWKVTASTINGYAFAKALHPEFPVTWAVEAVIKGIAQSPVLSISFQSILEEIPFSIENRTLTIGPLTSYMGQLLPDGIRIAVKMGSKAINLNTRDGYATLYLDPAQVAAGNYLLQIETLGLKTQQQIELR